MKDTTIILLAGGKSERFNQPINKVLAKLNNKIVLEHSLDKFIKIDEVEKIIVVYNQDDEPQIKSIISNYDNVEIVKGGLTRSESLNNALDLVKTKKLLIHDAARPYTNIADIRKEIKALDEKDVVTLYHHPVDAVKFKNSHIEKKDLYMVTTPQGLLSKHIEFLKQAKTDREDDLEPFESTETSIAYIEESSPNLKITYSSDLDNRYYKVGYSFDFHPFEAGKPLIIGGIEIPSTMGLKAHSDGDVLIHALTEAIYGSLHLGDLGDNYPDSDNKYLNISSINFLKDAKRLIEEKGYIIQNIDCMVYLEQPKLKQYKKQIEENIALILGIDADLVSVKATTMEKKGVIGQGLGIGAEAYVLVLKK